MAKDQVVFSRFSSLSAAAWKCWMRPSVFPGTTSFCHYETERTKEHVYRQPRPIATKTHNDTVKSTTLNGRTVYMHSHWHISDHSHIAWSQRHWKTTKAVAQMTLSPQPHILPYSGMQSWMKLSKCDVSPSKASDQSSVATLAACTLNVFPSSQLLATLLWSSSPLVEMALRGPVVVYLCLASVPGCSFLSPCELHVWWGWKTFGSTH